MSGFPQARSSRTPSNPLGAPPPLAMALIVSTALLFAPSITSEAVTLTQKVFQPRAESLFPFAPRGWPSTGSLNRLSSPTAQATLPAIPSGSTLFAPTLSFSSDVSLPTIPTGTLFSSPTVAQAVALVSQRPNRRQLWPRPFAPMHLPHLRGSLNRMPPATLIQSVSLPTIASGSQAFAPSITYSVGLSLSTIASGSQAFAPTLGYNVALDFIIETLLYEPTISTGVLVPFISSGAQVLSPSVAPVDFVALPTIADATQVNPPAFLFELNLPEIASGSVAHEPTLGYEVNLAFLASGSQTYEPTLEAPIDLPTIAATTELFTPIVPGDLVLPPIPAGTILYAPVFVAESTLASIASTTQVFPPTIVPGALDIQLPLISSGEALFVPMVTNTAIITVLVFEADRLLAPMVFANERLIAGDAE